MKKTLLALVAVCYLGTSLGATLHLHYCMGRLASWDLRNTDPDLCGACGMAKPKGKADKTGCCHDEHRVLRTGQDQKAAAFFAPTVAPAPAIGSPAVAPVRAIRLPLAPPSSDRRIPLVGPPLYRLFGVFLI